MEKMVSIIIPVYNGSNYMREAIDSALAQTYKNLEVIVVNDGSNDGGKTREIALSYGSKIIYIEKDNGGVSTALNRGIEVMSGDYFSWLSHDDVYAPTKIEKEIQTLSQEMGEENIVYCDYINMLMPHRQFKHKVKMSDIYDMKVLTDGTLATALWLIHGCSLLIPKSLFEKYGLFDERYRGVQDYLKWFEMFINRKLLYVDELLVYSRIHEEQQGIYLGERQKQENELLIKCAIDTIYEKFESSNYVDLQQIICMLIDRADVLNLNDAMRYGKDILSKCENFEFTSCKQVELRSELNIARENIVYIYGAGKRGKELLKALKRRNIYVSNFIDKSEELWHTKIENVECIGLDEVHNLDVTIIVSNLESDSIYESLKKMGIKNVVLYEKIKQTLRFTPFMADDIKLN